LQNLFKSSRAFAESWYPPDQKALQMSSVTIARSAFPSDAARQHASPSELTVSISILAIDAVLVVLASLVSGMAFHFLTRGVRGDTSVFLATGVLTAVLYCGFLHVYGTQNRRKDLAAWGRLRSTIIVWSLTFVFLLALAFGLKISAVFSRGTIFCFYIFGMATVGASRLVVPPLLAHWTLTNAYRGMEVLLVAARGDARAQQLRVQLLSQGCRHFRTIEFTPDGAASGTIAERRKLVQDVYNEAKAAAPGAIYVVPGSLTSTTVSGLVNSLRLIPRTIYIVPDIQTSELLCHDVQIVGNIPAVKMQKSPLNRCERILKRSFDMAIAGAALLFCLPLLTAIAIAIKLDTQGPVLFWQARHGYRGRQFRIAKFRSMTVQEDGASVTQATRNDRRVTKVGAFLRRSSLDELPQLWNVLCGDMSIIGPRPHAVAHDKMYNEVIENYEVRQHVRPGITGWAQVHGLRGETANLDLMCRRIEFDIWYATNCNFLLDLRIFFRTFSEVLRQTNAY
jgi:undecaprenyl-phosphate galactose phosphotransferase/putative colanic acid biosynthesis UDP-glucose lipid carrier transferase